MAFKEYRSPCRHSVRHEFNIERFAYDIFAYMLRIAGFPEERIPTSGLKENNYIQEHFVRNVGLSCLPINLYKRDEWRLDFETIYENKGFRNLVDIKRYLESFIDNICELEYEDNISKIQFSLALYTEFTLFLNYKGVKNYFHRFPTIWSGLCMRLVKEMEEFDQTLESSLSMCPDVSESWISNFIRQFAIPYENSDEVSKRFSWLTFRCLGEDLTCSEETSERVTDVPEEFASQPTGISDEVSVPFSSKDSKSETLYIPGRWNTSSSSQLQMSEENVLVEAKSYGRHTNGWTYVQKHCLNTRKRNRSENLEVENAFGGMNLEKENVSPENRDAKRLREISGKDELE